MKTVYTVFVSLKNEKDIYDNPVEIPFYGLYWEGVLDLLDLATGNDHEVRIVREDEEEEDDD